LKNRKPFQAKPDTREWSSHMLRDKTWKPWRDEHPNEVAAMIAANPKRVRS